MTTTKNKIEEEALKNRISSCLYWVKYDNIVFPPSIALDFKNHMYQIHLLKRFPRIAPGLAKTLIFKKAAQIGVTVMAMLTYIHGLKYGHYPTGVIHLFPTDGDGERISKSKMTPFIENNPISIGRAIGKVNEVMMKQIGRGYLYYQGARETRKLDDAAGSSSKLKSITADRVDYDEFDEMDMDMVELARYRIKDSDIKEEFYYSTPTLPDYGIDKKYTESDQSVWMIKCYKCGKDTCLELDFPDILIETFDGRVLRICKHCREPLSNKNIAAGQFIAQYPSRSKDSEGIWISSLSIPKRDPKDIYKKIQSSDPIVLKNVYNSDLAMPFMQTEDALTKQDIFACCSGNPMSKHSLIPTAMGVDVKSNSLHVVVGYPQPNGIPRITYMARVSSFNDVHDIAAASKVKCAMVDYEPETRKAREFRAQEKYNVYLVDYQERLKATQKVDEKEGILTVRRTETMDRVLSKFKKQKIILPRQSTELKDHYAVEMTKTAKILQEDKITGSRKYTWKKIGEEHYFHATNYFLMATENFTLMPIPPSGSLSSENIDEKRNREFDPLKA